MIRDPSPRPIHIEAIAPDDTRAGSLLVEHFNDPCELELADDKDASLYQAAHRYLSNLTQQPAVAERFGALLPSYWVRALDPESPRSQQRYFGWLPFEPSAGEPDPSLLGPYGGFRFRSPSDDLAVVFAAERLAPNFYIGSGFGLALAMHLRHDGGTLKASFTGMSATLPYGHFRAHPLSNLPSEDMRPFLSPEILLRDASALDTMASQALLEDVAVRGLRIAVSDQKLWIERRGVGMRKIDGTKVPHAVSMLSVGESSGLATRHTITRVTALFADATDARVFEQDPSSVKGLPVRPLRNDLDDFRVVRRIVTAGAALETVGAAAPPLVQVMLCPRFVRADRRSGGATPLSNTRQVNVTPGGPPVRSDDAAAVQAFFHADDLVQRLKAYGWTDPSTYFRITAPSIKVFYRSGISPGPGKDGRTVNARVIPEGWPADAMGRTGAAIPPSIEIHLASAELRRRDPQPATAGGIAPPPATLGIAADRRWMWHEFGHVLLIASTGELELRFAHSPGDAMAAIVADPDSNLPGRLRGSTFPFVFLPRRHDRCAGHGWSWSGTLHAALSRVPDALHPRRKGYDSEQILSSSLFRMYRSMGGDTVAGPGPGPGLDERRRASHYALYLIMQAMQLMGDARCHVTATAAQFVHWLRQADLQNGEWSATIGADRFSRVGGTLGKVIRWAFEAQGLYGTGNGPGLPEEVDIYIKDRRPTRDEPLYGDDDYGPGSYVPTSLHWQPSSVGAGPGEAPLWQADPEHGILLSRDHASVQVRVNNRGRAPAIGVAVSLWLAQWPDGASPPLFQASGWTVCQPLAQSTASGNPNAAFEAFSFDVTGQAPGRYILLAQATCLDDPAHTDPALSLACQRHPTPLADLVANDNNLGLLVVDL